jgi:chromate transporter
MKSLEVFLVFLRLGLTSFGGPIAHLGFFHDEFVSRRKWINEHTYADLVALCQILPGPASSQVGIALGLTRAGYIGAILAWIGFTLPSAILMIAFAFGITHFSSSLDAGILHGLKISAAAVVAQAIWGMFPKLCPDNILRGIAIIASSVTLMLPSPSVQFLCLFNGGLFGFFFLSTKNQLPHVPFSSQSSKKTSFVLLLCFFVILVGLPFIAQIIDHPMIKQFHSFYKAGAFVFGGGHVVLPLLKSEIVQNGWVTVGNFMAGYGAAQAIPGPLFTFSAYLGAISTVVPSGVIGGLICLFAVFLPSFLLIIGILPFWEQLRNAARIQSVMKGLNATVVGLLIAAFYDPVWTSAIFNFKDFFIFLSAFILLAFMKWPSWLIVIMTALVTSLI